MLRYADVLNFDLMTLCRFKGFIYPKVLCFVVLILINLNANAQQNNIYYYSSGSRRDTATEIIIPQHLGNSANANQDSEYYSVIRNVKAAKIIVSQAYEGATKINLPIKKMVVAFLRNAGIKEDTINNDLIISVSLRGIPLNEVYDRSGTSYSGAAIYCSLNIETLSGEKFSDQFEERVNPPQNIGVGQYQSPDNAPFYEVFTSIKTTLLKILYTPFGIEPFLTALTDQKEEITYEVIGALGSLNDKRAVEPLIQFLTIKNVEASALSMNSSRYDISRWQNVAVVALGNIGDVRAAEPLVLLLEKEKTNDSKNMYDDILIALKKITGKDYGAKYS